MKYTERGSYIRLKPTDNSESTYFQNSPLQRSCEKDLRISYLQLYEQNGCRQQQYDFQMDRSRTKDALKGITDKYGFFWNEQGKLKKRDNTPKPTKLNKTEQHNPSSRNMKQNEPYLKKQKKIPIDINKPSPIKQLPSEKLYHKVDKINKPQMSTKEIMQEKEIDQKIKNIWNKYQTNDSIFVKQEISQKNKKICQDSDTYRKQYVRDREERSLTKRLERTERSTMNRLHLEEPKQHKEYNRNIQIFEETKSPSISLKKQYPQFPAQITITPDKMKNVFHSPLMTPNVPNNRKQQQYDTKINEITQKIIKCEGQKEKLHIDFKRFDIERISKSKSPIKSRTTPVSCNKDKNMRQTTFYDQPNNRKYEIQKLQNHTQISSKKKFEKKHEEEINNLKSISEVSKSFSFEDTDINKIDQAIYITSNQQSNDQKNIPKKQNIPHDFTERYHYNINSEEDRSYSKSKGQSNKIVQQKPIDQKLLVKSMLKQIQLDEEFRNGRIWFFNNDDPYKWGILADKLLQKSLKFNYHELVEKFQSLPEERNPFFSLRDCKDNYESLIQTWILADKYWKSMILHKFNEECLDKESFTSKELDVESKGKLKVEDFVRYFNMKTNSFYRNRDIFLIFQRFAGRSKNEVQFSQIVRILTK